MSTPERTRRIPIERTFPDTTLDDVWTMWTTQAGIEAWWGPDGFSVTVQALDLRAGGELRYTMTAVAPAMIAFMAQNNMPTSTPARITFHEVTPPRRLAYAHTVDFVPGVPAYDTNTLLELFAVPGGVRLVLTIDAMHDDIWTERATSGWVMELGKLAALLEARAS